MTRERPDGRGGKISLRNQQRLSMGSDSSKFAHAAKRLSRNLTPSRQLDEKSIRAPQRKVSQEPLSRARTKYIRSAERTVDGDQVRLRLCTTDCSLVLPLEKRPLSVEHLEKVRASLGVTQARQLGGASTRGSS